MFQDLFQRVHLLLHFLHGFIELLIVHHRGLKKRHHHGSAFAIWHDARINLPGGLRIFPDVIEHAEFLHGVNLQRAFAELGDGMEPSVLPGT